MDQGKKRWKWWQKLAMGMAAILLVLIAGVVVLRRPWITPLPEVSLESAYPPVSASALGPDSAYRLLLEAIAAPIVPSVASGSGEEDGMFGDTIDPIWGSASDGAWRTAETKFEYHPWPATPPAPAVAAAENTSAGEEGGQMSGMPVPPAGLAPEDPWTLEQYREIPRLMAVVAPRVALLDRALAAADQRMPTPKSFYSLSPDPSQCARLVGWLGISTQYRAATRDHVGSYQDLARILGLADLLRRGSAANSQATVRYSRMAANAAWRIAMRSDLPGDLLQREAGVFLKHGDHATPYAEILRSDARSMPELASLYYPLSADSVYDFHHDRPPTRWEQIRMGIICQLGPILGSTPQMTARNLQAVHQNLIPIAEKPYSAALRAEYDLFQKSLPSTRSLPALVFCTPDPFGYTMASSGMFRHHEFGHSRVTADNAQLRGMALFLAIKAYERKHGALPERLDQLVPDHLPRVPEDPFDGKPFRYLRNGVPGLPAGTWAVYSIGEDFTDDGGKAHSAGTPDDDHGPNPDLVWPSCEYPKLPPVPQER